MPQLATVKRAAALLGVPYQTYIKQVALKQAIADIHDADAVVGQP
jgi:predicted DNA binding CopG/RHH family protein